MPELNLHALRTVVMLASCGSLSRAAVSLGMAQSAASRHLAEIERALGGALFHRTGRGVLPTDWAREALPKLQALLADADSLTQTLREQAGAAGGPVTLGLVPSLAARLASALCGELATRQPLLQLRVREGYSGDLETALAEGRVDLAVLNRYRAQGPNHYRSLFETPLCVVGRAPVLARLPGGSSGQVPTATRLAALAGLPLVLPVAPNALCSLLDDESRRIGLQLQVLAAADSASIIKRLLQDHDCASLLPRHAVADELAAGLLTAVPLTDRALRQQVVLATSSQQPFSQAAKLVAGLVPALVRQLIVPLAGTPAAAAGEA